MPAPVSRVFRLPAPVLLLVALLAAGFGQQPAPDDKDWKAFLTWLSNQPAKSNPEDLLSPYRAVLIQQGLSPQEAERLAGRLGSRVFHDVEGRKILWNKTYAGDKPIFTTAPNRFLVSVVEGRRPGKALDVGMGQGRNAVFLAQRGWEVTGIDPSDEAIRLAQNNGRAAGVRIDTHLAGDDDFDFGSSRWDLILFMYIRDLNVDDAGRIWKGLKPGGILVYENGADTRNQVLRSFLGFQIVRFEDAEDVPDWHPDRRIRVQRLVAQKADAQ